ncbi:hypothetical protein [Agrobacterium tumefaciens]|uniref:hypothetical protein n=1 Tax=Agrobacterium tumefaciens TaxID=358 RepID=UPI003BA2E305
MSNPGIGFDYEDSVRRFGADLAALGSEVLPRTIETMLNKATLQVQNRLTAYTALVVNKPNAFTKKAWTNTPARWQDGDRMWSEVRAQTAQAQYLWFLVNGGRRKSGDVGTNRAERDMFAFTAKLSTQHGVDRRYVKKLARQLKAEKKRRATYRGKRAAVVAQNLTADKQKNKLAKLKWVHASKNDPGIFLGTIGGIKGWWQRPERYLNSERQSIIGTARGSSGSRGASNLSRTRPGSKAKLLVALAKETNYNATFDYAGEVSQAFSDNMTEAAFTSAMEYQRRRQRLINGAPQSLASPSVSLLRQRLGRPSCQEKFTPPPL